MQMMNVLKPIAFDVVICMSQLFDYYLFAVSISLVCYVQYPTRCIAFNVMSVCRHTGYTQATAEWQNTHISIHRFFM